MDKGFLFNVKTLITNPRSITIDYILGKRKGILNPISFLIFSITLYLIVITLFKVPREVVEANDIKMSGLRKASYNLGLFIRAHIKYFWILTIFPLATSLKLVFKRFNYIEHLAISSFVMGQATLLGIASYLIFRIPLILDPIVYLLILWLCYRIFRSKDDKMETVLLSLTALMLFVIQLLLILGIIGAINYYY